MYVRPRPRFRPRNAGSGNTPSLALEFNQLSALPSYVTFSRGTQAMQYGSDGTLQYAPNNLLTYSNQADNAAWTKSNSFVQTNLLQYSNAFTTAPWNFRGTAALTANATTAPDGTNNGWLVTGIGALLNDLFQQITVASGVAYTPSFWIKRVSTTGTLQIANPAGTNGVMNVNFALLSDSWERITPTHPAVTVTSAFAGSAGNTGGIHFLNPFGGTVSFYLYGAQVVLGSVPGDYRATTSAALPVLYADYNGALRARKLSESTATAPHYAYQGVYPAATYTISCYAKQGERTRFGIGNVNSGNYAYFNLATGVVTNAGTGDVSGGTIISLGNGWYRCYAVCAATTSWSTGIITTDAAGNITYTGDGSSGIYIADAQLTPGYLPLAVTETTSAAVYGPRFDYDPSSLVTQNLLLYSEQFDNAVWTKTAFGAGVAAVVTANQGTAPDGTLTADRVDFNCGGNTSSDRSLISQGYSGTTVGLTYTETVYIKAFDAASIGKTIRYTIETGASTNQVIITLTSDWQRVTNTFASAGATYGIVIETRGTVTSSTTASVLVWGAQLNRGATALPYTATTTAPYTLTTARGLLIEEQRTNLATFSNTFSDASWTALGTKNVAASAVLSPEGVANAWTLTDSSAVAFDGIQKSVAVAADGTTYTGSIYILKTAGGTSSTFGINLLITGGTTVTNNPRINTDTGAVLAGTATVTNAGLWWRVTCSVTNNSSVGNTTLAMQLYPATAAYNSGTDTPAATGSATIYGAQIETGAFATSYIPTVGSTATRNADSASITTLTPWYNTVAGTWYAAFQTTWDGNAPAAIGLINGENASKRYLYIGISQSAINSFDGVTVVAPASGDVTGTAAKVASTYNATARTITNNAVAVASGTIAAGYSTPSLIAIGNISSGNYLCGWISAVRYYPTALPNASLQSITV